MGSNPVGTTIKSITSICLFISGSVLVSRSLCSLLVCNGVLLLDELPEFRRNVLEVMRQPLEDGNIIVSRALGSINCYSRPWMFVAAMNPCARRRSARRNVAFVLDQFNRQNELGSGCPELD